MIRTTYRIRTPGSRLQCLSFRFPLTEEQARARGIEVDETLDLIKRGRLTVPEGVRLEDFVAAGAKAPAVAVRPSSGCAACAGLDAVVSAVQGGEDVSSAARPTSSRRRTGRACPG